MPKVYVLIGVPGSGKSTWASKQDAIIISSDKVREALYGDENIQGNSGVVFNIYYERAFRALKQNQDIILDATNIKKKDRKQIFEKLGVLDNIKFVAVYFNIPIEVCIFRNEMRERKVPRKVIKNYYRKMCKPSLEEGFAEIIEVR